MENLSTEITNSKEYGDISSPENNNICNFCKKVIEKENEINLLVGNTTYKYCSINCKNSDINNKQLHDELNETNNENKIRKITLEELFNIQISLPEESNKGITGIINIGNTCFMNSGLQCLSNCYQLTKYFLSNIYLKEININNRLSSKGEIAKTYRQLLKDLWEEKEKSINPTYFKNIFSQFVNQFSGNSQQDSNEFLIFLLDKLHEDVNIITKKEYLEIDDNESYISDEEASDISWKRYLKRENSMIVDLFYGQFKSTINCKFCNKISKSFDSYNFISIPIPSKRYEINIKYFGYNFNGFSEEIIPINEDTLVSNIIDKIKLKTYMKKEKKFVEKTKKKRNNNNNKVKIEELCGDSVEILLLTNDKKIYKVLDSNDYIYLYIQQGYEVVAYEKDINKENIYFYISKYYENNYFSFFNSKQLLFDYPFVINSDKKDKIYTIYQKISKFLKIFSTKKNKETCILNNNFKFEEIRMDNEKGTGFIIYLNTIINQENNTGIFSYLFHSSSYTYFQLLEKFSGSQLFSDLKKELNLKNEERIIFDINILFNFDNTKLSELNINPQEFSYFLGNNLNLYDCIKLFNSEEILEGNNKWYCNKCKEFREVVKKMEIYKSPYYLIIQIKRFRQDFQTNQRNLSFENNKNNTFIDFPIKNLDLSDYILSNSEKKKYNLIGVINHYGGYSSGHYTCYCLNDYKWYEFNDQNVSLIENELDVISSNAYVLFYKRIE